MWDVAADPLRFEEALAWLRARVPVTASEFRALSDAARRRAFTVGGVADADVVADVLASLEKAVEAGTDFNDWRKAMQPTLETAWKGRVPNPGHRLELIFRQNVQSAYAAGRFKQQRDPDVVKIRPYWLYDAVIDTRTSSVCRTLNGTLLLTTDPWWRTRYPPNHWNCRAGVRSLTRKQAAERGGPTKTPTTQEPDAGFRSVPKLGDFEPGVSKYPNELRPLVRRKLGAP